MNSKARAVFRLARPFTLVFPALSGVIFSLMALKIMGNLGQMFDYLIPITCGSFALLCCNFISNVVNQCFDDEDKLHSVKSKRPIASGELSEKEGLALAIFGLILVIFLCSFVNALFTAFVSFILLFALIYSIPPVRLKKRLWLNNLCICVPRGGLGILASFAIVTNPFAPGIIAISVSVSVVLALYVYGGNTAKDFGEDEKCDRACGIRNFVTIYGPKKAGRIASAFIIASYVALILFSVYGYLPFRAIYLVALLPIGLVQVFLMSFRTDALLIENNRGWFIFYVNFALLVIGFAGVFLL